MLTTFIKQFDQQVVDLAAAEALWDRRAAEVNEFVVAYDDFALQQLARYLPLNKQKVLEISFGAGRHLAQFLQQGAQVAGVELSGKMCQFATQKLNATGLPWQSDQLVRSSWEDIDLADRHWHNAFDLVFLYMSPALSNTAMLKKALDASRRGLYLVLYSYREDSLLTSLQQQLGLEPRPLSGAKANDLYLIFNILYGWGYFPQLQFEERARQNAHQPGYILERYASWLWREPAATEHDRHRLLQLLQQQADASGKVLTRSRDIVGHLWLDKTLRRQTVL